MLSLELVNVEKADSFVQQAQLGEKHIALEINLELQQEASIEVKDTVIIEVLGFLIENNTYQLRLELS